jgi:hypothetical protein
MIWTFLPVAHSAERQSKYGCALRRDQTGLPEGERMWNKKVEPIEASIRGYQVSDRDQFWVDYSRSSIRETIPAVEKAARQLVVILGFCQTAYFAALSFSDIKVEISALLPMGRWFVSLLFILPLFFWLISLVFTIKVFTPRDYQTAMDSPKAAQEFYYQVSAYKQEKLHTAFRFMWFGFIPMLISIGFYLLELPPVFP